MNSDHNSKADVRQTCFVVVVVVVVVYLFCFLLCASSFLRGVGGGVEGEGGGGGRDEANWENVPKEEINTIHMLEIHFGIEPFSRRNTRVMSNVKIGPVNGDESTSSERGLGQSYVTQVSAAQGGNANFQNLLIEIHPESTLNPPTQRRTQPSPSAARSNPHSASSGGNLPRIVPLVSAKKRGARGEHSSSADAGTESKGES